jgi:hypothetical protein
LFARLESPAELDFATHGVCSCKRYTRASAHNVARGYDDRAATTAALMCLLPGSRAHTRSQKSRAPQKPRGNVEGADTSPATRGLRRWRQDGGEATSKTPQLPRVASVVFRDGRSPPRAFFSARVAVGTRRHRPLGGNLASRRRQRSSLLCFIASVGRFRAAFLSGPGSVSDSLRHSVCKAHITSKHSLASKTAAQRIKADICGSALPPSRNE